MGDGPYREAAPLEAAPPRRSMRSTILIVLWSMALGFVLAALVAKMARPPALAGSVWRGAVTGGFVFTLKIESIDRGRLSGWMDWGGNGRAAVHGSVSVDGKHLRFVDDRILRAGNLALGDEKDVRIDGDTMTGTDRNGGSQLRARRVRSLF